MTNNDRQSSTQSFKYRTTLFTLKRGVLSHSESGNKLRQCTSRHSRLTLLLL